MPCHRVRPRRRDTRLYAMLWRLATAVALLAAALPARGADNIPDLRDLLLPSVPTSGGVRGFILFGAGVIKLESNTVSGLRFAEVGSETITDINASPEGDTTGLPVLTGELTYTFGTSRWQFYLGTGAEDLVEFDLAQQLGFRKQWKKGGVLTLALVNQSVPSEVWADPYLTGVPRETTDLTRRGARIAWDRIGNSGFGITLQARTVDVEDELSGVSQGLSPAELALLDRNGEEGRVRFNYAHQFGARHLVEGGLTFTDVSSDGEAVSSQRRGVDLKYSRISRKVSFVAIAGWSTREFDARNPVYGEYADSDSVGVGLTIFTTLPPKGGRWIYMASLQYAKIDSDIDFFDAQLVGFVTGVAWKFGKPAA